MGLGAPGREKSLVLRVFLRLCLRSTHAPPKDIAMWGNAVRHMDAGLKLLGQRRAVNNPSSFPKGPNTS